MTRVRVLPSGLSWAACVVAWFAALWLLLAPAGAQAAYTPPPLRGHVVDPAGHIAAAHARQIDRRLDAIRQKYGFAIVAFVAPSLDGLTIEDVAYETFNAWGVGRGGKDDGVLLVVAPIERKVRIETGKGVGGALTDLESNDILRTVVIPAMRAGRVGEAVERGTVAVARRLARDPSLVPPGNEADPATESSASRPGAGSAEPSTGSSDPLLDDTWRGSATRDLRPPRTAPTPQPLSAFQKGGVAVAIVLFLVLLVVSPTFRGLVWNLVMFMMMFGGRGGGGGFGGGGGGGYSGGGGRSGGGGSSGSY